MKTIYESFLSPIDNYSDLPFRLLCQRYGAVATCVPLVSSTALSRDPNNSKLIDAHQTEQNLGLQLVGNVPEEIGKATKIVLEKFPFIKWLNLNCGCPSVRTMHCGGGSALLSHPKKICQSIKLIRKSSSDVLISIKMRLKNDLKTTLNIAKLIEASGADFLILHSRTAGAGYSGAANWDYIKEIKDALNIPLVGNGDLKSQNEGKEKVKLGHCDSFMIARSAMSNPKVFENKINLTPKEKFDLLDEYIDLYEEYLGPIPKNPLRLKATQFMSSFQNASLLRSKIAKISKKEDVEEIKKEIECSDF